ncbi:MAG: HAD family hydrolase [Halobacteria archaeon]|nr:HAD family hydrolase [Halobacteria archaeon]
MRLVLDYGGTVVDQVDESEYSRLLDERNGVPSPGYIAYKAFSLGILDTEDEYIRTLSLLTGVSEEECRSYLERRKLAPELPDERKELLEDLAEDHELVLFSDQVETWIEESLRRFGIRDLFDDTVVSSEIGYEKPHPEGYARVTRGDDEAIMVSDELNADLLMADYFGMTTVWVENDYEEVHYEPDYVVDDLVELDSVLREERERRDG